ncbi:MAG: hypothetical protein SO044_02495 [Agathobaculum sp.]|uniref:hypothetical protein n=1 Tax=Agathobaculum sp. TaxID=2048138 RepID=UPI002A840D98|nr:hypothetical protein [Agathobaculum sp.]MDY3711264.1 hypothetical protein [Agathobaculum sp.]
MDSPVEFQSGDWTLDLNSNNLKGAMDSSVILVIGGSLTVTDTGTGGEVMSGSTGTGIVVADNGSMVVTDSASVVVTGGSIGTGIGGQRLSLAPGSAGGYLYPNGSAWDMKGNVTVPRGLTVTVTESRPLTIADDYTLTLDTGARLINDNNSITVNENGKLKNNGIVELTADGYHWDAAGKTLTLHGISITGSLKLPDVSPMRVVTEDESYVDRIEFPFSYSSNVLFSGTAPLTVQQKISDYQSTELTTEAGAALRALSGIEVGVSGGVDSSITVNGMLTSNGGSDNYALYAGKVTIGSTGALTVSGDKGVRVNGVRPLGGNIVFTDAFKLENGGKFTGNCNHFNVMVFTYTTEINDADIGQFLVLPSIICPAAMPCSGLLMRRMASMPSPLHR